MAGELMVQGLPELLVCDRLTGRGFPLLALPLGHPGLDAFLHILRVRHDQNPAGAIQAAQGLDDRSELHPVIGGVWRSTEYLFFLIAILQQRTPAARAGVALAGAIGMDYDFSGITQWLAAPALIGCRTLIG